MSKSANDKSKRYEDSIERAIKNTMSLPLPPAAASTNGSGSNGTSSTLAYAPVPTNPSAPSYPGITIASYGNNPYTYAANTAPNPFQGLLNAQFLNAQFLNSAAATNGHVVTAPPAAAPSAVSTLTQPTTIKKTQKGRKKLVASSTFVPGLADSQLPIPAPAPQTLLAQYEVKARPAVPPNWEASYNQAIHVIAPYHTIPVPKTSFEYGALANLVEPHLKVTAINRIVNPELWRKFAQTRKDLMSRKVEDLTLLGDLGLPEDELLHRVHVNTNFDKNPSLATDYSDNVALLFHGSRGDMEAILSQGLDERLGNAVGGLLGRGIYFADDPLKSAQYDQHRTLFLFMVLLGDCLNVDNVPNKNTMVREPTKQKDQQRNHMDIFFDSITGRPGHANEYVIYNRYHCCPLYTIAYSTGPTKTAGGDANAPWRSKSPPFAWTVPNGSTWLQQGTGGVAMPPPTGTVAWPFFAQTIFSQMEGDEEVKNKMGAVNDKDKTADSGANSAQQEKEDEEESLAVKLSMLTELGFTDDAKNMEMLKSFDYDVEKTIDALILGLESSVATQTTSIATASSSSSTSILKKIKLDKPSSGSDSDGSTKSSSKGTRSKGKRKAEPAATLPSIPDADPNGAEEECTICCVDYPSATQYWRKLKCEHKLCVPCHDYMQTSGTTMSGTKHTFLKCPFCKAVTGVEIGTCPDGSMTVTEMKGIATPGHGNYSTYSIQYYVRGTGGINRTAYIPGSPEGLKVLELLKVAFDRRLIFVFGTSATTGAQNVLVWNIHHKTSIAGGVQSYGYPDPTYLTRVQEELAQVGVV